MSKEVRVNARQRAYEETSRAANPATLILTYYSAPPYIASPPNNDVSIQKNVAA
jgi:hypothetical protein